MSSQPQLSDTVLFALENAFQNPARNLTKSRGKNIHRYASVKIGKRVTVESTLECDACYHFDFTIDVIRFCSQPIRLSYCLDEKRHCSGQLKLATVLEFSQYNCSDSFGVSHCEQP